MGMVGPRSLAVGWARTEGAAGRYAVGKVRAGGRRARCAGVASGWEEGGGGMASLGAPWRIRRAGGQSGGARGVGGGAGGVLTPTSLLAGRGESGGGREGL
jgi:hypothetical protein